jgi:hypothetical protein
MQVPIFKPQSPKVCHITVLHQLRDEINFLETDHFRLRAVQWRLTDLRPLPKNYLYRVGFVLNILSRSFYSILSHSTFSSGQTDRNTHTETPTLPFIDKQVKFFMPFLVFFTSQCLLHSLGL